MLKTINDNNTQKNRKRILIILIVILMAAALSVTAVLLHDRHERFTEEKAAFDDMIAAYDEDFPAYLEKQYDDFPMADRAKVNVKSEVKGEENHDWYTWEENIEVTVFVSDEFDRLSKREIWSRLKDVSRILSHSQEDFTEDLPGYKDFRDSGMDEKRAFKVRYYINEPVIRIKTSANTYELAPSGLSAYGCDYYLNGEDQHYPRSEKAPEQSSAGSGSSGYNKSELHDWDQEEDPYNARDYANSEDFYEDHYDDFFSFEEADDYFEDRDN